MARENYHTGTTLSRIEWIEVLHDKEITYEKDLKILQALYPFQNHQASAGEIGRILGYNGKNTSSPISLEVGNWGKRLSRKYNVRFTKREDDTERKWDIFFDGWQEKYFFIWRIKSELVEALKETGLTGEEFYPDEISIEEQVLLNEGQKKMIVVNSYERNAKARQKCVEYWGAKCDVCGLDFEKKYGDLGKGFVHVHHLTPLSEIGSNYKVHPVYDLRPVCPNCHAIIHKTNPPMTIEELRENLNYRCD